ncbi:hypothetical protein GCM10009733_075440 [Nonomuraea maheshkhaliensis]|uniref:Uncharacterized protein n=1 Tax=Nonomuraea maheshkhaliensis TaxID=419590 RepID=A0ABP4S3J2_9ACTN
MRTPTARLPKIGYPALYRTLGLAVAGLYDLVDALVDPYADPRSHVSLFPEKSQWELLTAAGLSGDFQAA